MRQTAGLRAVLTRRIIIIVSLLFLLILVIVVIIPNVLLLLVIILVLVQWNLAGQGRRARLLSRSGSQGS